MYSNQPVSSNILVRDIEKEIRKREKIVIEVEKDLDIRRPYLDSIERIYGILRTKVEGNEEEKKNLHCMKYEIENQKLMILIEWGFNF